MNAPDVLRTYPPLIPEGHPVQEKVPARVTLSLPLLRPGSSASKVQCPILFGICGRDSVAPAHATLAYAETAPKGVVKWYEDMGHFEIYYGESFRIAIRDYVRFFQENLPVETGGEA